MQATDLILSLNENDTPITSLWIDELHGAIMERSQIATTIEDDIPFQYLVPAGRKRRQMSYTTLLTASDEIVQYAPWRELESEMERFCAEFQVCV